MKIDRRVFLSFVAGGAAGTALSPLPWKLMDDFSIWSQVWPWVPVPKGGESTYVESTCSLCPGGCGIVVRKIDNRAVKIEGLKGHPINDGSICGLGLSGLQLLYSPTRVKTPMKRVGSRGSGNWQKISWNEAISTVANELSSIRNKGDAHNIACISGSERGTVSLLMQRFFQAYGSPNFTRMPSNDDVNRLALKTIFGYESAVDYDFENSDFILSFGSGLTDGWNSPVRLLKANSKWRDQKTKVVQVETTFSNTAAKACQWVPINPGTEADLAFGIASFIVNHKLYDAEFISQKAVNFDEWTKVLLSHYPLDSVSRITGVNVDIIANLSKSFASAARPIALCGRGKGSMPVSFRDYASTYLLNILTGNINKNGGVWICNKFNYIDWPSICVDDIAKSGLSADRIDKAGSTSYPDSRYLLNNLISDLKLDKVSLKALFVDGANPCYSLPDTASVKEAFRRIPLLVSFSSFMDETTAEADLILPKHVYLERFEDVPMMTGSSKPAIGLSKPVVSPQFNTRHLGEIIIELADAIGGTVAKSFPWINYEQCLEDSLGRKWDSIHENGLWVGKNLETLKFDKINFSGAELPAIQADGNANSFPLVLVPCDSIRLSSNYIASPPFLIKTLADTVIDGHDGFVDINPQTAEVIGLRDGDYAILSTPKGQTKIKVHLYDGVKPGVVTMLRGLGHTAYDGYIAGKGVNVNDLIGPVEDPVFGHDAFWGIRAKLAKA